MDQLFLLLSTNPLQLLVTCWGAIFAGMAVAVALCFFTAQSRSRALKRWEVAFCRLHELYDQAQKDNMLAVILAERPDHVGTMRQNEMSLHPRAAAWVDSLLLAFAQVHCASIALSAESKRVWRRHLTNQLNKPTIRTALVRDGMQTLHDEFWLFVRGVPSRSSVSGYERFVIRPICFMPVTVAPPGAGGCTVRVEPFAKEHLAFWLEVYRNEEVKRQMYAAPVDSEASLLAYLAPHLVFTAFVASDPIGGFTLTKENEGRATFGVVLHPASRGRGLAKLLMSALEREARRLGIATLRCDVYSDNEPCIRMLQATGFREFIWFEKNIG